MEVTNAYLYTVGNLPKILDAIQKAQVPEKFTHSFLKGLDFKSTNDRAFINVLNRDFHFGLPSTVQYTPICHF
jgi:hypothetical protein